MLKAVYKTFIIFFGNVSSIDKKYGGHPHFIRYIDSSHNKNILSVDETAIVSSIDFFLKDKKNPEKNKKKRRPLYPKQSTIKNCLDSTKTFVNFTALGCTLRLI